MSHGTKIATCCYCGTRAVLVLKGRERHELACSSCGAPLHVLKQMPVKPAAKREIVRETVKYVHVPSRKQTKSYRKPKKKRKSFFRRAAEEIFDVVEDIFD